MMESKSVIIIGAGIAGPLLAVQLKRLGHQVEIFEAREKEGANEGVFLGLTPNGLNVLGQFIPIQSLRKEFTNGAMYFFNRKGKEIAVLPTEYQRAKYGNETIQVKRSHIYKLLHELLEGEGIAVRYGCKATEIKEFDKEVVVAFENGQEARAHLLFGCDGAFSVVRNAIFPGTGKPSFTKNIGTGGFAHLPGLRNQTPGINMTFGTRGFFAYAVSNQGEIWWFNNYYREKEPTKEETRAVLKTEIVEYLLDLHKNDDPLFSKIIKASHEVVAYPVYDIPKLGKWHTKRVCLIGDAAHATSPHVGQGASLAMEDTVCVVNSLLAHTDPETAFKNFQLLRQPRVEKIIQQARKVGSTKSKPNPIAVWFRDRVLKFFLHAQIKKLDWIYGYQCGK